VSFEPQEPLLSDEETLALLAVVRETGTVEQVEAQGIDLASQDRRMAAAQAHAERVEPSFHVELKKMLRRISGAVPQVRRVPADVASLDEVAGTVPLGAGLAVLQTRAGSLALLVISPALALTIIDRRLGAPLDTDDAGSRGALSPLDRAVLRSFIESTVRSFGEAWCGQEDAFTVRDLVGVLDADELGSRYDQVLRTRAYITLGKSLESDILFALSSGAVRDTLPTERQVVVVVPTSDHRQRIAIRLTQAEVDVVAYLGSMPSTVKELLALSVGDVIRLDHVPQNPIDVRVGGITKMRGMPVVEHGNLAVRIVETV
jgi:flagellar motor switch protein FliM